MNMRRFLRYFVVVMVLAVVVGGVYAVAQTLLMRPQRSEQVDAGKAERERKEKAAREKREREERERQERERQEKERQEAEARERERQEQARREQALREQKEREERERAEREQWERTHGNLNGHEWVDLGLPSGLKWATCNVGATKPEDYGNYYAWGETTTKSDYDEANSLTHRRKWGDISGNATYDAARANWGGTWRLPTKAEIDELVNNCTWIWTTQGGHNGYKVTGPNGNFIFLPSTGCQAFELFYDVGSVCDYWSSTPKEEFERKYAYNLRCGPDNSDKTGFDWRKYGRSVRPVTD